VVAQRTTLPSRFTIIVEGVTQPHKVVRRAKILMYLFMARFSSVALEARKNARLGANSGQSDGSAQYRNRYDIRQPVMATKAKKNMRSRICVGRINYESFLHGQLAAQLQPN
jgi:hypothetical protein